MTCRYSLTAVSARPPRRFRLWIPILLVWVLLLPFALLLAPLVFVACLMARVDPFRGVAGFWPLFCGPRGVRGGGGEPGGGGFNPN